MTDEKREQDSGIQAAAPSGDGEEPSGGEDGEEADADSITEAARERFPAQVDAALAYVAENKYAYGPRLSRTEMEWTVTAAQPVSHGMVRVTVEYTPSGPFRGTSGSEYLDVDEQGAVLARRQIRTPKEAKPWLLISLAAISVIAAAVLVPFILIRSDAVDNLYVQGRTLWMRAERPVVQDAVHYKGKDTAGNTHDWAVTPLDVGTDIAVVEVTIINATSGSVVLVVDETAAELRLEDIHEPVRPVLILARSQPTDNYRSDLAYPEFIPIWGSLTINEGHQVQGHMAFEVPEGANIREFRWRATDSMTVRY